MTRTSILLATLLAGLGSCSKTDPAPTTTPSATESVTTSAATVSASAAASAEAPTEAGVPQPSANVHVKLPFDELVKISKPLAIKPAAVDLAGTKLTAVVCAVEGAPFLFKSTIDGLRAIRVVGDRALLVTNDGVIRGYKLEGDGCKLVVDKTFGDAGVSKLDQKVERLSTDGAGNVWASTGASAAYRLGKDGKVVAKCDAKPVGHLFVSEKGKTAIATFANDDVVKVTFDKDACKTEKWAFTDLTNEEKRKGNLVHAQAVGFLGDMIFLGGRLTKTPEHPNDSTVVLGLDAAGKERFKIGKLDTDYATKDRFHTVNAIGPCRPGLCVLDATHRRLTAWSPKDGKFLGDVELSALFGLREPWIPDFDRNQKAAFFIAAQDRETKGVAEGNVFRVSGL